MNLIAKLTLAGAVAAAVVIGYRSASETPVAVAPAVSTSVYRSPVSIAADATAGKLFIAQTTANSIATYDLTTQSLGRTYPLPGSPNGLVARKNQVLVTCGGAEGRLCAIATDTGRINWSIRLGHTPMAPVLSPDGSTLYVCNRFNNSVSVINLADRRQTASIPVVREPVAAALTPDGKTLAVANHLPAGRADSDSISAAVSLIDTLSHRVSATITLPNGSTSLRGLAISPEGEFAYVTHVLAHYQLPTTQLERGWMNTAALSIVDLTKSRLVNTVVLDEPDRGAANPWAVQCTADGKFIAVTHAGTHDLSLIDRAALHDKLARVAAGQRVSDVTSRPEDVPSDLGFLTGLRRRLALPGNGPRGLAIVANQAYVTQYFTDSLASVSLDLGHPAQASSIPLGPEIPLTTARKGEMFFNDASLCFQQWQSCASCHPDARTDGLNWDLMNDGIGNPKNTRSMLYAHRRGPMMALGIRQSAEVAVRAGIKYIQFANRPDADAAAIDEYLKTLRPEPSPYLVNGRLSDAATRGEKVFESAGCLGCHSGELTTNFQKYDLKTGTGIDKDKPFSTPTLVEIWRTAPYLHDGRSATMMDVLTVDNPGNLHGNTARLSKSELSDLAEFILSN